MGQVKLHLTEFNTIEEKYIKTDVQKKYYELATKLFKDIRLIYFSENEKSMGFSVQMLFEYNHEKFQDISDNFREIETMQKKYEKEKLPSLFPELSLLERMVGELRDYLQLKKEYLT